MAGPGGSEAATKELLRLKEAEVDQLWHERFEDRRKMDEHFAELQHAILSLQNEKSQYQMESTNDKQVCKPNDCYFGYQPLLTAGNGADLE